MRRLIPATLLIGGAAGVQARPARRISAPLIGETIVRGQWAKAENRADCAPLGLVSDGRAQGVARAANFSGGWAVAFDLPGMRSAYGFAGTGLLPDDDQPDSVQRERLTKQWPSTRDLRKLPAPAFAGYGLMGAKPYPAANPSGKGLESLAYLRIGGQRCTYNVWSRLSRAHLESLLDNLRILR
ncbi:hypothetical protein DM806_23245 [Sphingobium lactosutens]|uniref:hypothetical protein n=1 Tax=Sphingobium lactosutens TaxID=522773 RepID=UPI0015B93F14|nr:hypothetical protein [Sphingobium lactosutens]NWK98527.1 hypothetical protein [Sphingobium lactosutens]